MKTKPIVWVLALASLFLAILLPPEANPNGKLAIVVCGTFAFAIALSERKIPKGFINAGIGIFGLLLLHSFVVSIDLYRSLEMTTILWAYYCLIGFFMFSGEGVEKHLAFAMVGLSLIVSGYGLYQYFWGFDRLYEFVFYAASDQMVKVPALEIISNRRVSSTLALPGTLWGFLVCALPFHAILWRRSRLLNATLVLSATLLVTTGFLTRSFGFLVGLLVLAAAFMLLRHRRLLWNLTPLLLVLVLAGGLFYSARRSGIEEQNPAGLRFKNWVSAWNIFTANPWGTGLGTFGVIYPEYMQPAANESQYAHNTPLQLLSELGYPLLFGVLVLIVVNAQRLRQRLTLMVEARDHSFWILLALSGWVVHNLIDIDVYFASVGTLGAVLIGALLSRGEAVEGRMGTASTALVGVFAAVMVVFAGLNCVSSELQHRAQIEFENKKLTIATQTLALARRIMPINSSLHHEAGEIQLNLYHALHDPQYLTAATDSFRTAIAWSPEKAGSHIGYALCLSTATRMPEAIAEIRAAQQLFPSSAYIQSIAQLMEQRIQ
jgi:hypothetical protein